MTRRRGERGGVETFNAPGWMTVARAPLTVEPDAEILVGEGHDGSRSAVHGHAVVALVVDAVVAANVTGAHPSTSGLRRASMADLACRRSMWGSV